VPDVPVSDPAVSRRRAVVGAAVGGLSLPLLSACGGGSGGSTTGGTTSGGQGGSDVLVGKAQVPVGGGVILADQNVVVTQPAQGTFDGFSATCTHQGCVLASVASGTINCGCHGSQFSISDGSNVAGPSGSAAGSVPALPKVPVKVKGPNVIKA
jgi:Rieske Fe-S protein